LYLIYSCANFLKNHLNKKHPALIFVNIELIFVHILTSRHKVQNNQLKTNNLKQKKANRILFSSLVSMQSSATIGCFLLRFAVAFVKEHLVFHLIKIILKIKKTDKKCRLVV